MINNICLTEKFLADPVFIGQMFPISQTTSASVEESEGTENEAQRRLEVILDGVKPQVNDPASARMMDPQVAVEVYKQFVFLNNNHHLLTGMANYEGVQYEWLGGNKGIGLLNHLAHYALRPIIVKDFMAEYKGMPPQSVFDLAGISIVENSAKSGFEYPYTYPATDTKEEEPVTAPAINLPTPDDRAFPDLFVKEASESEQSSSQMPPPLVSASVDKREPQTPPPLVTTQVDKKESQTPPPPLVAAKVETKASQQSTSTDEMSSSSQTPPPLVTTPVDKTSGEEQQLKSTSSTGSEEDKGTKQPAEFALADFAAMRELILAVKQAFEGQNDAVLLENASKLRVHFNTISDALLQL